MVHASYSPESKIVMFHRNPKELRRGRGTRFHAISFEDAAALTREVAAADEAFRLVSTDGSAIWIFEQAPVR
jgi:hypothetical protein